MITGNEPATPFLKYNEDGYGQSIVIYSPDGSKQFLPYESGLTIRQHFAAMAMQGMVSNPQIIDQWNCFDKVCEEAVKYADALITELNKEK